MLTVGEWVEGSFWPEPVEIKRCEAMDETYYIVEALGRTSRTYFESVLDTYQLTTVRRLQEDLGTNGGPSQAERLVQAIEGMILAADRRFSAARSRGNHQVLPLPHQVEAVYGRMLQTPLVRFLLADDPGAGKTIMSGMLIRELRVRGLADRVLILVPPLVLTQWQNELEEKFGESFRIINRTTWDGHGNPFAETSRCLASIYWVARPEVKALATAVDWDLVIVDEAHKMAAYTQGKKVQKVARTQIYRLGEALLPDVPQCLLLTATPHKGDPENFRHLMRLIDPDVFQEVDPEQVMRERANPYIIRRLKESMVNFDGTPIFPPRTTKTIAFDLTPEELTLYEAVTHYVQEHFNQAQKKNNGGTAFAMMLLQRRLSSSLEAITLSLVRRRERLDALLTQTLEERSRWQVQWASLEHPDDADADEESLDDDEVVGAIADIDTEALQDEILELDRLISLATGVQSRGTER
ncbi:MAG: DEAD/DEAH box helicase, partial [Sulfobacillus thermotolerans]|nr:DEAD/DEAH box helicase [Sulfobacillus thermotolerans]